MTTGYVYLIHFDTPYRHARHYLGYTTNVEQRLAMHAAGRGARLMAAVHAAGIHFTVAWVRAGDRQLERRLKDRHEGPRLCPLCALERKNGGRNK